MNDTPRDLRRESLDELEQWARTKARTLAPDEIWRLLLGATIATAQATLTPDEIAEALRQTAASIDDGGLGPPSVQ